jgi:hypothetical protein
MGEGVLYEKGMWRRRRGMRRGGISMYVRRGNVCVGLEKNMSCPELVLVRNVVKNSEGAIWGFSHGHECIYKPDGLLRSRELTRNPRGFVLLVALKPMSAKEDVLPFEAGRTAWMTTRACVVMSLPHTPGPMRTSRSGWRTAGVANLP